MKTRKQFKLAFLSYKHLSTITVAAIALFNSTLFIAPNASASSGGGCNKVATKLGNLSITACISANGLDIVSDAYFQGQPPSRCQIYIEIMDSTTRIVGTSVVRNCTPGKITGYSVNPLRITENKYTTRACIFNISNSTSACNSSPSLNYPY